MLTRLQLLVLQPTPFCNLNCSYCYLPHRSDPRKMDEDMLAAIGARVVSSAAFTPDTTVLWHAGEPMVLPAAWYVRAAEILEAHSGRKLGKQSFQTNATLINEEWLEYLKRPDVSLGVSLDGPAELHDTARVDRAGKGSHAQAMSGIAALHGAGIRFHLIAVVTASTLEIPEAFAHSLLAADPTSIGLNFEEIEGINTKSTLHESVPASSGAIARFLDRFIGAIESVQDPPRLRERDRIDALLTQHRKRRAPRNQENSPGAIISVGIDGDISTFSPELMGIASPQHNDFRFGNVKDIGDLTDIFFNRAFLRTQREVSLGVARCRKTCGHYEMCGGGAPANKLGETGRLDTTETAHCRLSIKAVADAMIERRLMQAKEDAE